MKILRNPVFWIGVNATLVAWNLIDFLLTGRPFDAVLAVLALAGAAFGVLTLEVA